MTLRVIRRLKQGRLAPFASLVGSMLAMAFLVALAREQGPLDTGAGAVRGGRTSSSGAVALAAGESATCIPTAAHVAGAAGTSWRTDLEVHNPGTTQASYSLALLRHGELNTSPVTQSFTLGSGQSVRYVDVVHDRFAFNGKAALRVTATSGTVVVTSRTYNDQPAGTYGQFVPAFPDGGAIGADREGRLIQLSHQPNAAAGGFRTNLGAVNAGSGTISVEIELFSSAGALLGQVPMTLRGYEYQQVDKVFERVTTTAVAGGYAVVRTSTAGGRFFAYASVIDNRTGDPVFIPASNLPRGSAPPTPTPTPTRTPTSPPGGTVNLKPYTPPGWQGCVVCNHRQSSPPVSEALYVNQATYLYCAIANLGTTTFTGPLKLGVYFDGTRIFDLTWSNPDGLPPNYYLPFQPTTMTVYATGQHTVEVRIDPDNAVPESNETDNSCAFTGTWSGAPLSPSARAEAASLLGGGVVKASPPRPIGPTAPLAATAYYVATSAHASGAAGTNWRTDLELHNAGSTQASVSIALLKHGQSNSSPDGLSVTVAPGQAVRYTDAVFDLFSFSGKAALRLETASGSVVATSRTYNDQPGGTYGQFVPASPDGEAIGSDREGRLIQLSHQPNAALGGFRTNVGAVNAGSGQIAVTIDLYASSGAYLGQVPMSLRAYEYQQIDKVFERVTGGAVASGYAVVRTSTTGGRFFAYASVIDNRTGDPVFIPATNLPRGSAPPTPTPGVITGPGGTSITLPSGGTTPDAPVTITTGSGTYLPKSGETLVSTVIKVNVGGDGVSTGAGSYVVRIPVTGTVSDPSKLLLKVQTSVGPVYPVAGVYDSGSKTFSAELMRLWNGWNMGVVVNPGLRVSVPSMAEDGEVGGGELGDADGLADLLVEHVVVGTGDVGDDRLRGRRQGGPGQGVPAPERGLLPLAEAVGRRSAQPEGAGGAHRPGNRRQRPEDLLPDAGSPGGRPGLRPHRFQRRADAQPRSALLQLGRLPDLLHGVGMDERSPGHSRAAPWRAVRLRRPRPLVPGSPPIHVDRRRNLDRRRHDVPDEPQWDQRRHGDGAPPGAAADPRRADALVLGDCGLRAAGLLRLLRQAVQRRLVPQPRRPLPAARQRHRWTVRQELRGV
ncbi:MAG: CARDB domain-containing protein [Thermoanaerobaculaceae bacterium]